MSISFCSSSPVSRSRASATRDAAALRSALEQPGHHVAQVDADFFHRRPGDQLDRREGLLLDVDFHHAVVELAGAQLLAHPLARAAHLVARPGPGSSSGAAGRGGSSRSSRRSSVLSSRLDAHFLDALVAHHVDRDLDQIADHRFDVAADVADLGELRRLDLDERRMRQLARAAARSRSCRRRSGRSSGCSSAPRPRPARRAASGAAAGCAARSPPRASPSPGRRRTCRARRRSRAASGNRSRSWCAPAAEIITVLRSSGCELV